MTILLDENFAGTDPRVIGFPSISTCLGLVAETQQALYGIHVFGDREDKARAAARAIAQMLGVSGETIIHLYGAANRSKRTPADWTIELGWIAEELDYHGQMTGYDLAKTGVTGSMESIYVEFRRSAGGGCAIYYKRDAKMDYDVRATDDATLHANLYVVKRSAGYVTEVKTPKDYKAGAALHAKSKMSDFHKVGGWSLVHAAAI